MALTVLILAKNEEKNIKKCLESAKFADEIIVIDDFSADNTKTIAESLGAKVYQRSLNGDFGAQQTFAIEKATSEWIFILDADERITQELAAEVQEIIKKNEYYAYKIPRLNHVMGEKLRYSWSNDYVVRLFPCRNVSVEGLVHQKICHPYPEKKIKHFIIHYPYVNWEQYFNKFNLYTKLAAEKNYQKGKRVNFFWDIIVRPQVAFFKMYILKSGWRDGKIGFIMALYHYFYTMTKYVRLYYLQKDR